MPKPNTHYACPLGFMEVLFGKEEYPIKALVEIGEELKIITKEMVVKFSFTTRKLNMNIRGIGANTTSLVALSEFTPVILDSVKETQTQFFIKKGSVHRVLGRPLFSENNMRLDLSHKQG
ncbi:hypothetical protein O181_104264 [Austropuccinia psidii MF-1]|uniref:Uncharacterized protein n=1 Tax=Austropuccinia psidii MF-1 TaxID=1389203 RepID=A0A9Q3JMT1_9BASI|nr:hypothetical protein [Austropuccinia psidii MF-1]